MTVSVFGLEMPEELAAGWSESAQLLLVECREDGSVDIMLVSDSGTFRYLATAFSERDGIIAAPPSLVGLATTALAVLESNEPVVRRSVSLSKEVTLSLHPLKGVHDRVAVIVEPAA